MDKLAQDGGAPAWAVKSSDLLGLPPGAAVIDEAEERLVLETLRSRRLFRYDGSDQALRRVEALETEWKQVFGTGYALAISSGTLALVCGLVALGVGPGDEVIVPAYTYVATASAVVAAGAVPIIAEVDESLTLDPADAERKITPRTKAIIPVHMRGTPCRMDQIMALARRHNLKVLEDVAQACGGSFGGQRLGSIGDVGAFSLNWFKIISAGEGGVLTTNDARLFGRAEMYHDPAMKFWASDAGRALQIEPLPGIGARMSEIQAAMALAQLRKLDDILVGLRRAKHAIKNRVMPRGDLQFRAEPDEAGDSALTLMFFAPERAVAERWSAALRAEGIPSGTILNQGIPDRHIYCNWSDILTQRAAVEPGCSY
ncbi:MAG: aminotransferase class I/II-fold pyridoxal phosphate-dependent enzyme, partial [Armatimonadota bacterium]|nr:aminotransferase class I/II-fold pyridoxal phosphate-dependent enzyme [Armatimonadota bacterium]